MINIKNYEKLSAEITGKAELVAVSKLQPIAAIKVLFDLGQRAFGENYVQELLIKKEQSPPSIEWHFIGHLQKNKVKYLAPFIHLIQSVDSLALLAEINKQGKKVNRRIAVLLQVYIATEESKFGLDEAELDALLSIKNNFPFVEIKGLMGMASFTNNDNQVRQEMDKLASVYKGLEAVHDFSILSMGMSQDYPIALAAGSNLIRIGSLLFGDRVKN